MEALATTLAAKEDAMAAINAMVQQGLELQDILVLLGDELGLDLVAEDEDGNEVEEDLDDVESASRRLALDTRRGEEAGRRLHG